MYEEFGYNCHVILSNTEFNAITINTLIMGLMSMALSLEQNWMTRILYASEFICDPEKAVDIYMLHIKSSGRYLIFNFIDLGSLLLSHLLLSLL